MYARRGHTKCVCVCSYGVTLTYVCAVCVCCVLQALASELKHGISSVPTFRPRTPGSDAEPNVIDTLFGVEVDFEYVHTHTHTHVCSHRRWMCWRDV